MRRFGIDDLFGRLARMAPHPTPAPSLDAFREIYRGATGDLTSPIARAMVGGFLADRPAWAFAVGYQEALRSIRPSTGDALVALAATEEGGNHPRAIRTRLEAEGDGYRLSGSKRFVTLGPLVEKILVVATRGEGEDGRPRLAIVEVPRERQGVDVEPMPELPFVPELPHGTLTLRGVRVEAAEVDAGDGYLGLLKPFRTVEDLFVAASFGAHAWRVARRGDIDDGFVATHLALLAALFALGDADPAAPTTHVALEGALRLLHRQLDELPLDAAEPEVRERFRRDLALLTVAAAAREKRFHKAMTELRRPSGDDRVTRGEAE